MNPEYLVAPSARFTASQGVLIAYALIAAG